MTSRNLTCRTCVKSVGISNEHCVAREIRFPVRERQKAKENKIMTTQQIAYAIAGLDEKAEITEINIAENYIIADGEKYDIGDLATKAYQMWFEATH